MKNIFLCIGASFFLVMQLNGFTFDARDHRFDELVNEIYDFAQNNQDVMQLSEDLIALHTRMQNGDYEIDDQIYWKVRMELHACILLIAKEMNEWTLSQDYIDNHS